MNDSTDLKELESYFLEQQRNANDIDDNMWDVIIVGSGPSGAMSARCLSRLGIKTLLIDQERFPRDKVCGDALIPDAIRCLERLDILPAIRKHSFNTPLAAVYSPSRVRVPVAGEFSVIRRLHLDAILSREAIEAGATLLEGRVSCIEQTADGVSCTVKGRTSPLSAKYMIIATGADEHLVTKLNMATRKRPSATAIRCYYRSPVDLKELVFSLERSIMPGYAWIFPLKDQVFNIGCGVFLHEKQADIINLKQTLQTFFATFPLAKEIVESGEQLAPPRGAVLRCGLNGSAFRSGRILATGETIGSTFPASGEGIGKAIETGLIAAEAVSNALNNGDSEQLAAYEDRLKSELLPKYKGYKIMQKALSHYWLVDFFSKRAARSEKIRKSMSGIINETLDPAKMFSPVTLFASFFKR